MSVTATGTDHHTCLTDTYCRGYDPIAKTAATTTGTLCDDCLDNAQRDISNLTYDYLDLAQLHQTSMSQAINEKTGGSKEKTMLLAGHVEALQAEMVHVLTTWEYEVRVAARLSDPQALVPVASWNTTITRPVAEAKMRAGAAVQRAVGILSPRLRLLSLIPATAVCPTGVEDDPTDITGWEAVLQIADLHRRSRGLLGRTRRTFAVYGTCPKQSCGDQALHRDEPRGHLGDMPVWCATCHTTRTYADYEHFMTNLEWPAHPDDEPAPEATEQVAA